MDSSWGVAGRRAACAEPRRRALACLFAERRLRVGWQQSVWSSNVLGKIIMGTGKTKIAASMLELIRYIVNAIHIAALVEKRRSLQRLEQDRRCRVPDKGNDLTVY